MQCQLKSRCANPVLNLKLWELKEFLKANFEEPLLVGATPERRQVACGRKSFQLWDKKFATAASGDAELGDFFFQILEITDCVHTNPLEKEFNRLF